MIELVIPRQSSGGVYDFSCQLQEAIGRERAVLVELDESTAPNWVVGIGDSVVLQYSGYGFATRGAPIWLLREIRKRRKAIGRLGVFFHELYALGPIWSSSFWLSPVQRYIARRLAEQSDFWMTNREASARWLRRFARNKPCAVLPVFSTVGEILPAAKVRAPKIVVFGSTGLRCATYSAAGDALFAWAQRDALTIHDVGPLIPDVDLSTRLSKNGVVQHGRVEAAEVRLLLSDSQFGVVTYPVEYMAKSSVFAAYCAHGVCPVLLSARYVEADGLVAGLHYLPGISSEPVARANVAAVAKASREWYQWHNIRAHAGALRKLVSLGISECL